MPSLKPLVFICPLDWGLGHASRVIPVISRYLSDGYRVMLGGSGKSGILLKTTFPELPFEEIASPEIRYAGKGAWLILSLMLQIPGLIFTTFREHLQFKKIVRKHGIAVAVSDNRYGLFYNRVHTVIITHQISPVLPRIISWVEYPLYLLLRFLIHNFDECWIPDYADVRNNLTGKLTHRFKLPRNACFVGILSRFSLLTSQPDSSGLESQDLVVVLSGPQPQLSIITNMIITQAEKSVHKILVISGLQQQQSSSTSHENMGLSIVPHLNAAQFKRVLLTSNLVICRSGYSSIMDLVALGIKAIIVPTPGQTEQEYLATYLSQKGLFHMVEQSNLDLDKLLSESNEITSVNPRLQFDISVNLPVQSAL